MKYRKRILIPCILPVKTDRQLRQAQSFNDRLDILLSEWESATIYPINALEAALREQAVEIVALMQHSVIEGICGYVGVGGSGRTSPADPAQIPAPDEENGGTLPGAYVIGKR